MSKLDIRVGYHHLVIHKKSRFITVFDHPEEYIGTYEW
jgi:hypothetical protein